MKKNFFKFETMAGLAVALVVLSALTGLAGNALKALGMDAENIGLADALTGLATLVVAALGWLSARRSQREAEANETKARRPVRFVLVAGETRRELPLHLRARECARAEVLGRLGMLPVAENGKRFSLVAISRGDFLEDLNEVQDGFKDEVIIQGTEAEIAQFDWAKMAINN